MWWWWGGCEPEEGSDPSQHGFVLEAPVAKLVAGSDERSTGNEAWLYAAFFSQETGLADPSCYHLWTECLSTSLDPADGFEGFVPHAYLDAGDEVTFGEVLPRQVDSGDPWYGTEALTELPAALDVQFGGQLEPYSGPGPAIPPPLGLPDAVALDGRRFDTGFVVPEGDTVVATALGFTYPEVFRGGERVVVDYSGPDLPFFTVAHKFELLHAERDVAGDTQIDLLVRRVERLDVVYTLLDGWVEASSQTTCEAAAGAPLLEAGRYQLPAGHHFVRVEARPSDSVAYLHSVGNMEMDAYLGDCVRWSSGTFGGAGYTVRLLDSEPTILELDGDSVLALEVE